MYKVESLLKMSRDEVVDLWFNGKISWELKNQVEDIRYEQSVLDMQSKTLFDAIKDHDTDWDTVSNKIAKNKINDDYNKFNNLLDNHYALDHQQQIENMRQMEQVTRDMENHIAMVQEHNTIVTNFNNDMTFNHMQFVNNF